MLLLCCVLLLASPVFSAVCNLENCHNITSSTLEGDGVELGEIENFNLATDVVVLTGLVEDNCLLSLVCTSDVNNLAVTNFTMSFSDMQPNMQLRHTPKKTVPSLLLTLVNTTITDVSSHDTVSSVTDIGIQFHFEDPVFAYYYTDDYKRAESQYNQLQSDEEFVELYLDLSTRLLKGVQKNSYERISRMLSATECGEDLTISLCPCLEPVITELEWNNETSILNCTAVSVEGNDNLSITWTENGVPVQDNRTVTSSTGYLMKTSSLLNVTSTEEWTNYTCTASLESDSNIKVTRTKRIAPRAEGSEVKNEHDGSQALLTIIVSVVVGGSVAIVLIGVGIVKLVRHFAQKNPEPSEDDTVEPGHIYNRLDSERIAVE